MRSAIIACALMLGACAAPADFNKSSAALQKQITQTCQRYEAQRSPLAGDCWVELAEARARNAATNRRIQAVQSASPPPYQALSAETYSSAWQSVAPPPTAPSPMPINRLDSTASDSLPVQTWGQTRCDVVIPPALWDMPTTYRHPLIPPGC